MLWKDFEAYSFLKKNCKPQMEFNASALERFWSSTFQLWKDFGVQ